MDILIFCSNFVELTVSVILRQISNKYVRKWVNIQSFKLWEEIILFFGGT